MAVCVSVQAIWLCLCILAVVDASRYPTGPESCTEDPDCEPVVNTYTEWPALCLYGLWGLTVLGCVIITIANACKDIAALTIYATVDSSAEAAEAAEGDHQSLLVPEDKAERMKMLGYKDTVFGWMVFCLVVTTSVCWLLLYLVLVVDFYWKCQLAGLDKMCFFGEYPVFGEYNNAGYVCFFWVTISSCWFMVIVILGARFRNLFRQACPIMEASRIWVWTPDSSQVFSSPAGQKYVLFECTRYLLSINSDGEPRFQSACMTVGRTHAEIMQAADGLDPAEYERRWDRFGPNNIPFNIDSLGDAMLKEFFRYYYVYQYAALGIWLWWSYLFVGGLLMLVVIIAAALNITISRDGQAVVYQMTKYSTKLKVKRQSGGWEHKIDWNERNSDTLVPGDVIIVQSDWIVPCDLAIISGSAICDESGLTGESMPVRKVALEVEDKPFSPETSSSKNCLFAGTRVLQSGVGEEEEVEAVVINCGIHTSKGQLVSQILFPTQMQFKYDEELPVVFVILCFFGIVATTLGLYFRANNGSALTFNNCWPGLLCMVSQICHPLLPMALTVGQTMSCARLKTMEIFCLDPKRISISGKIKVFCFDKTGTLTKDGLDFLGCHMVAATEDENAQGFAPVVTGNWPSSMLQLPIGLQYALATCHCVSAFGESLVGNQVEVKMFGSTGWKLLEQHGQLPSVRSGSGSAELQILRRYDFDHARQTMSVITKDKEAGTIRVFCKGSFEKVKGLCTDASLPPMYDEVTQSAICWHCYSYIHWHIRVSRAHAMEGCYVLAVCSRELPADTTIEQVHAMQREDVECAASMEFQSLLLFRNELKEDTAEAIAAIKQGNVRVVMITGDNAQCGMYIARASGMIDEAEPLLLGTYTKAGQVEWTIVGEDTTFSTEQILKQELHKSHEIVITGDPTMHALEADGSMSQLLLSIRIFARMTPDGKVRVVTLLQGRGLAVGMCGDGGNDCGALRVAHAGVALSDAEASMVSAFSGRSKSVFSVFHLLREGRASLATSFACFKFLVMYGILFAVLKLCCYYYGVLMPLGGYFIIDLLAVVGLSYAITVAKPKKKLLTKMPPSSLLGITNALSVLGMVVISGSTISMAFWLIKAQDSYVKFPAEYSNQAHWWTLSDSSESTVIFTVVSSLFVTSAVVFSIGGQFRQAVWKNVFLIVCWLTLLGTVGYLLLSDANDFTRAFHMASEPFNSADTESVVWRQYHEAGGATDEEPLMSFETRLQLFLIIISACMLLLLWERYGAQGTLRTVLCVAKSTKEKQLIKP